MDAPRTLLLWDVDHTLIENGGVSKDTYALAFEMLTGRPPNVRPQTDGRTDSVIMRDLFASNGEVLTPERENRVKGVLVAAMRQMAGALAERGHALPGAREALAALMGDRTVVQSVLTGNIVANARAKLAPFGLEKFIDFEVGGFGSDDPVRSALVGVAQRRAETKFGQRFDRTSTVIVGDTVRDVEAGLTGGARVLAVATGVDSEMVLRAAGADEVIPDLADLTRFLEVLDRVRRRDVSPSS